MLRSEVQTEGELLRAVETSRSEGRGESPGRAELSLESAKEGDLNQPVTETERDASIIGSTLGLGRGIAETIRISVGTIWDSRKGDVPREVSQARLMLWSERCFRYAQGNLTVVGREHSETAERFVIVSNHQSLYDIPVLFLTLGRPIRMLAKEELFRVPIWGPALTKSEFVPVSRSNRRKALASLDDAAKGIASGLDIWVAPEGTRSPDGVMGEFKRGGFHVALAAKVRILPVTIDGTHRMLPARTNRLRYGVAVTATVHPPVDPAQYGRSRMKALVSDVRRVIAEPLGQT